MNCNGNEQDNNTQKPFSFEELVHSMDGGKCLPEHGIYNVKAWANLHDCSEDTILRWLKTNKIKVIKHGKETYVRASRFNEHETLL